MKKRAKSPKHRTVVKTQHRVTTPVTREFVHSLRGRFKGKGLLKALMAEKRNQAGL